MEPSLAWFEAAMSLDMSARVNWRSLYRASWRTFITVCWREMMCACSLFSTMAVLGVSLYQFSSAIHLPSPWANLLPILP